MILVFGEIIIMKKKIEIILLGAAFIGATIGVVPIKGEGLGDMLSLDLNLVKKQADVIVTARLIPVPPPYEVLGKDFFRIMPDDAIAGSLVTNSLLVVKKNVLSSEGTATEVQTNVLYMLFLQKNDLSLEGLPDTFVAYSLVGNWKGIVSLNKHAVEQRAVCRLESQYGIRIDDVPKEFVEAMKATVDTPVDDATKGGQKKKELSEGAKNVYNTLKLEKYKGKSTERFSQ